jgi:hypothetical protein
LSSTLDPSDSGNPRVQFSFRRPVTADGADTSRHDPPLALDSSYPLSDSPLPSPTVGEITSPPAHSEQRHTSPTTLPLLHRLSLSIFSSTHSTSSSPVATLASPNKSQPSFAGHTGDVLKANPVDETPQVYLSRLFTLTSKSEIAGILSSK